jgi:hypothetical protein
VAALARRCPRVTRVWGMIGARQRIGKANCRVLALLGNLQPRSTPIVIRVG